jgi:hypothetical protein
MKQYKFTVPSGKDPAAVAMAHAAIVMATAAQDDESFSVSGLKGMGDDLSIPGDMDERQYVINVANALASAAEREDNQASQPFTLVIRELSYVKDEKEILKEARAAHPRDDKLQLEYIEAKLEQRSLVSAGGRVSGKDCPDDELMASLSSKQARFFKMAYTLVNGVREEELYPFEMSMQLV